MPRFKPVSSKVDFPAMEREILAWWETHRVREQYLRRNENAPRRWSFLDGPITANNPMGVHHAWGRTYKDLFQRYRTMRGFRQRYQNGFDCQGLWVEVEVEKDLGFSSKRDIERYGIEPFVNLCKHRVLTYAAIQTRQSLRLGMWMDWNDPQDLERLAEAVKTDPRRTVEVPVRGGGWLRQSAEQIIGRLGDREIGGSYFTLSDENNYQIWGFLKRCHERGLIYKGHDVMPWCPRCATGLSEHEIATEGYKEVTHRGVFLRLPLLDEPHSALLVWTTTPWTLTSNVAAAVHPGLTYVRVRQGGETLYLEEGALGVLQGPYQVEERLPGAALVGRRYRGPFDHLPPQQGVEHRVIPWSDVTSAEGTGIVHIAPGCGAEDFQLSREHGLPVIAPIDEDGVFLPGFGELTGLRTDEAARPIIDYLTRTGRLYKVEPYTHRYPVCWRCGTELVFRLVDEWFIRMDPLREELMAITRRIRWIPGFGLDRELDWLRNMHDWMISKKRYWGLALPIYECSSCGAFEVIGSREELRERAVAGWETFEGHSPHRPWVDAVKIRCPRCGATTGRIADVGNPWLDAGIVSMSTLHYRTDPAYWRQWFPADFITESFPGQYRNWFYSLLVMAAVLAAEEPFRTCLGHGLVRDEQGREMHKSWGNAIEFNEAADRAGVDTMRWLYVSQNPAQNLNFGYGILDDVRRRFIIPLWNVFAFLVTYASLETFELGDLLRQPPQVGTLDRWLLSRLTRVVGTVAERLDDYDPQGASRVLEAFVDDLSNWYVRRSRRRFWKSGADEDKRAAYYTLYRTMRTLTLLLAPFIPFLAERLYQDLVRVVEPDAPVSVHLCDFPEPVEAWLDDQLEAEMDAVRRLVTLGRAARGQARLKVRQPLPAVLLVTKSAGLRERADLLDILADELNVKAVRFVDDPGRYVTFEVKPRFEVLGPRYGAVVQAIARQLRTLDPGAALQALARDGRLRLSVDGRDVVLTPEELEIRMQSTRGYAAEGADGEFAILETALTPDLVLEGRARELVHQVQTLRKELNLAVNDRIVLHYEGPLQDLLAAHREYIMRETLTVEVREGVPAGQPARTLQLDGAQVRLALARHGP
ncbi:MAG: class I tRNA ligase family protein [Armatimonadota bacterium]|nr:class I tRNA ligase family protein [Armatimonadota bacterium]MDR7451778.1 class I tRNA ligase family protein [Armatimonadota bacterium]MDR7467403.1 class I tRNA ligase family protein [Armatimonadota bacterium]MDR7494173.1 class I tRNA ligase family protein [Armatimonadota bacterium]MDR7498861.1 class I tRNA ligase family protein [Armatimonadota bacterium]